MGARRLDQLASELGIRFGLSVGSARTLLLALVELIFDSHRNKSKDFVGLFADAGLPRLLHSWFGKGANEPITPSQVFQVLGLPAVMRIANELDIHSATAADAISAVLPDLVSGLSGNGALPASAPEELLAWLGSHGCADRRSWRNDSIVKEWAPWLMVVLLLATALLVIRGSGQVDVAQASPVRDQLADDVSPARP